MFHLEKESASMGQMCVHWRQGDGSTENKKQNKTYIGITNKHVVTCLMEHNDSLNNSVIYNEPKMVRIPENYRMLAL